MSGNEPKGTDAIRAEIAQAYRNHKAEPCLSMGLRTEVGVHELCDKHYDAGKTESIEHCAVCKLEAELKWLQREHVRVCSSESALREVANLAIDLVEDYTVTDKRLVAAVANLLEDT